jgi:cytochrome c
VPRPSDLILPILGAAVLASPAGGAETGDPARGADLFGRACAACHSLQPGRNKTGPSLAGIVGRKAGDLPTFRRYSPALKGSGVTWDPAALDAWIANPQAFVPGNRMPFRGIPDPQARADIVAYLAAPAAAQAATKGGIMGA